MAGRCTQSFAQLSHPVGRDHKTIPYPPKASREGVDEEACEAQQKPRPANSLRITSAWACLSRPLVRLQNRHSMAATQLIPDHP